MSKTTILRCVCDHAFQDREYGHKMRVHNKTPKEGGIYNCTVCGAKNSTVKKSTSKKKKK